MRTRAWLTVGFTYFLMVWGNLVSATGSGLGCPDWPLCHGTITPPFAREVFFEWGHRLIAFTTAVLICATIYQVLRSPKLSPSLKRLGRSLLFLLVIQILLGALTVLLGLSLIASTVHLMIATFVFSGMITLAHLISSQVSPSKNDKTAAKIKRLACAGLAGLLLQFVMGAILRHGHLGLSCSQFPLCLEGFFPVPLDLGTALAFTHRWWGVLLMGVFVHLFIASRKLERGNDFSKNIQSLSFGVLALALLQIMLGIWTVLSGV